MRRRADSPRRARRPRLLVEAGLALVVAAVVAAGLLLALDGEEADGRMVTIVVPAGTKERLDDGDRSAAIPRRIEGRVGDTLRIVNRDRALHVVGGFPVTAGQTIEVPLRNEGVTEAMCTAHPDEKVAIVVRPG